MAVVLVTALLILAASLIGLRGRLMQLFPSHLVFAMVVGLGLFLTLVSEQQGQQGHLQLDAACTTPADDGKIPQCDASVGACGVHLAMMTAPPLHQVAANTTPVLSCPATAVVVAVLQMGLTAHTGIGLVVAHGDTLVTAGDEQHTRK